MKQAEIILKMTIIKIGGIFFFLFVATSYCAIVSRTKSATFVVYRNLIINQDFTKAINYGIQTHPQPSIKTWVQVCPGDPNQYLLNVTTTTSEEAVFFENLQKNGWGYLWRVIEIVETNDGQGAGNVVMANAKYYKNISTDCFSTPATFR